MNGTKPVNWGIIGPGTIARTFAGGLAHSRTGRLAAIATRNPDRPGLAEKFPGARIVAGYQALLVVFLVFQKTFVQGIASTGIK